MSVLYVRDKDGNLVPIPFISGGGGGIDPGFASTIYTELDKKIDNRIGDIDTALDEIIALQEYYTGATFDELHAYATDLKGGGE